jgi:O-antigen/teichoic acid export membrane protein
MRKVSLSRNLAFNFLSWLLPLSATFVFTPVIVHGLGIEAYGLYALVSGFITYSFYFAISRAILVHIAEYRVKGETEKIGEVISATLVINLSIGAFALIFFFVFANWLITDALHISAEYSHAARISFYLAGVSLFFMMLGQVFNAAPQALHRFDIYSSVATVTTLLVPLGNVMLVLFGRGVVSLFVWNASLMAANGFAYWLIARKLLPETRLTLNFSRSLVWTIIKYSAGVTVYQSLGNVIVIFERSWLTRTQGQEALSYYVVPMTIALCLHTFINSLALVIFPMATEANARQDVARLQSIYTRSLKFLNVLIVFLVVTLCVSSRELLTVWMGEKFAEESWLVLVLQVISFGLLAFIIVIWSLVDGLGRPWFNALLVVILMAIAAPVMIFLTPKMGAVGTAYGRFFSTVLPIPIYTLLIERWIFGKCLWRFWGRSVLLLGLFGAIVGALQRFLLSELRTNWLTVGFVVCASALVFGIGLWMTSYFESEEKSWLINRFSPFGFRLEKNLE